jgi:hypothetical protein
MRVQIPALAVALLVAGLGRPAFGQSLGDVAKKEEERRKTVKEPGKVYTNKDLGTEPPDTVGPVPDGKPSTGSAPSSSTGKGTGTAKDAAAAKDAPPAKPAETKDQKYWAGRMGELRTQLARDETYLEALQTRVNSLNADFVNRDDPAQRAVVASSREKALAELERLRQQIESTKKAIAALEEEARRANVPPGWLR